mmetsp:Transcript_8211/g.24706  ORF Transcript_8211/g.24706 Transcript_8211/m.24706 type:complete len:162 (-) Transcript_8211:666-1151(-)
MPTRLCREADRQVGCSCKWGTAISVEKADRTAGKSNPPVSHKAPTCLAKHVVPGGRKWSRAQWLRAQYTEMFRRTRCGRRPDLRDRKVMTAGVQRRSIAPSRAEELTGGKHFSLLFRKSRQTKMEKQLVLLGLTESMKAEAAQCYRPSPIGGARMKTGPRR